MFNKCKLKAISNSLLPFWLSRLMLTWEPRDLDRKVAPFSCLCSFSIDSCRGIATFCQDLLDLCWEAAPQHSQPGTAPPAFLACPPHCRTCFPAEKPLCVFSLLPAGPSCCSSEVTEPCWVLQGCSTHSCPRGCSTNPLWMCWLFCPSAAEGSSIEPPPLTDEASLLHRAVQAGQALQVLHKVPVADLWQKALPSLPFLLLLW